jgi:outer membrane protein TolC
VGAKKLQNIQEEMVALLSKILNAAEELVRENQQGSAVLHQPKAQLAKAQQALLHAEESVRTTYCSLLSSMGVHLDTLPDVSQLTFDDFPSEQLSLLSQEWLTSYLKSIEFLRPDIVAANVQIESVDKLLTAAKNSLLPNLNLFVTGEYNNALAGKHGKHFSSTSNFSRFEKDYIVGVNFSYPLGNDVAKGSVMQQRASKYQAIANFRNLLIQAQANLEASYTANNYLIEQLTEAIIAEKQYKETVSVEIEKLKNGLSDYFVVLQLQQDWLTVSQTRIGLEMLFAQNLAELQFIAGTLVMWERGDTYYEVSNVTTYPDQTLEWTPYEFRKSCKRFSKQAATP